MALGSSTRAVFDLVLREGAAAARRRLRGRAAWARSLLRAQPREPALRRPGHRPARDRGRHAAARRRRPRRLRPARAARDPHRPARGARRVASTSRARLRGAEGLVGWRRWPGWRSRFSSTRPVSLVDGQARGQRLDLRGWPAPNSRRRQAPSEARSQTSMRGRAMRDEHDGGQRRDAAVVVELLAAVVRLGAVAQDLHDDAWIHHRRRAFGVSLQLSADHRHVRIRGEARGEHPHAEVGAVDAAGPPRSCARRTDDTATERAACSGVPPAMP